MLEAATSTLFRVRRHEWRCRRHFRSRFQVPDPAIPIAAPVNILVFVNRSGSSLVSEYLEATGKFSAFGEPLSAEMIIERSEALGLQSFEEYLRWLFSELSADGKQVGMKASLDQVLMLLRSGAVPNLFTQVRWVFLERLDVLAQAISFSIATQTGRYYSHQRGSGAMPEYNFRRIRRRARAISRNYADCRSLLSFLDLRPYHLTYEGFLADPLQETRKLAAFLGEEAVEVAAGSVRLEKQADEANRLFRERFIAEMSASLAAKPVR
jgi:LPS sulfotransferase NodH